MASQEHKLKHLDFVQLTITRLAANSFLLKAWAVTLVAALFALAGKDSNQNYLIIAFLPAIAFWALDAYYLHQEKLYRALYEHVCTLDEQDVNFSMVTKSFKKRANSWLACALSHTIVIFYGTIVAVLLLKMFGVI